MSAVFDREELARLEHQPRLITDRFGVLGHCSCGWRAYDGYSMSDAALMIRAHIADVDEGRCSQ